MTLNSLFIELNHNQTAFQRHKDGGCSPDVLLEMVKEVTDILHFSHFIVKSLFCIHAVPGFVANDVTNPFIHTQLQIKC